LEVYGLLITSFAILLLLSLVSFHPNDVLLEHRLRSGVVNNLIGPVGAHIADLLFRSVGVGAFFACSTFFYFGGLLLAGRRPGISGGGLVAYLLTLLFSCVLAHILLQGYLPFGHYPGGLTGEWVGEISRTLFATTGTLIIGFSVAVAGFLTLSGLSLSRVAQAPYRGVQWLSGFLERVLARGRGDGGEQSSDENPRSRATSHHRQGSTKRDRPLGNAPVVRNTWVPGADAEAIEEGEPPSSGPVIETAAPVDSDRLSDVGAKKSKSTPKRTPKSTPKKRGDEAEIVGPAPESDALAATDSTENPSPADAVEPQAAPSTVAEPAPSAESPVEAEPSPEEAPKTTPPVAKVGAEGEPEFGVMIESREPMLLPNQDALPLGDMRPFEFPSLSLLDYEPPARRGVDRDTLSAAAQTLETKLRDFGVKGKVVKIQPGPVVTMFEFLPEAGVKISKITNLTDDLTMALHAQRVRIVAPIPGKGVVGIEVPSAVRETVYLKEILASDEFQAARGKMPLTLGKDIVGHPVVADLAKMPHLLVAGSTGSGKSVAVNSFICSLLYRLKPTDLRLILVDPKMLELSVYDDIPHLLLPVVTEPQKASLALKWAVTEMERRYRLLAACGVRNISGFNQKLDKYRSGARKSPEGVAADELEHLPFIVIVLDELADLMMVAKKDVEQSIARLAQMARAAGIHLVVATQRPSVDVVTGLIKANFPTRMSFMVSQKVDSRTILDRMGAENLLGMGDMLYLPPGSSKLTRVQGCFVSDDEVERIVDHLKQFGPPNYDMDILIDEEEDAKDLSDEDYDTLFDDAVAIVTETRNASISYLQRRLKIGYNRSARIIERMEFDGIISRADHRGVRKVIVPEAPPT
jgi:S-DNA-T family DNA segregation ATPase FtsK/SpoIIIE